MTGTGRLSFHLQTCLTMIFQCVTFLSPPKLQSMGNCGIWFPQRNILRRIVQMMEVVSCNPFTTNFVYNKTKSYFKQRYNLASDQTPTPC